MSETHNNRSLLSQAMGQCAAYDTIETVSFENPGSVDLFNTDSELNQKRDPISSKKGIYFYFVTNATKKNKKILSKSLLVI